MGSIMGSQNIMGSDYGSNISVGIQLLCVYVLTIPRRPKPRSTVIVYIPAVSAIYLLSPSRYVLRMLLKVVANEELTRSKLQSTIVALEINSTNGTVLWSWSKSLVSAYERKTSNVKLKK
jgi:hypothetical protein